MSRRSFVAGCVGVAAGVAAGAAGTVLWQNLGDAGRGLGDQGYALPVQMPDRSRDVTLQDLDESHGFFTGTTGMYPVVLLRLPVARLRAAAAVRGYNTGRHALAHPGDGSTAIVAYDARCTHMGCTVGWAPELGASKDEPDYDGDGANDGRILCPCHQAQFDVHDLGRNVPATPAPRPLAVLDVELRDGTFWVVRRTEQPTGPERDGSEFDLRPA